MKKYLHPAIIKKDITRFAPLWGLYTAFMVIFLLLFRIDAGSAAKLFDASSELLQSMGYVHLFYGGLCALALFGDLFDPKLCHTLHTMPLTRECHYFSHLVSGLLFCLIPSLFGALISASLLGQYAYGALLWLGLTLMAFLFFFGIGVFSVMCAGTKLGAAMVYALLNSLGVLANWFLFNLCRPMLHGLIITRNTGSPLSPLYLLSTTATYLETTYDEALYTASVARIYSADWLTAGILALAGIIFLLFALLIYKKRAIEAAGSLLAYPPGEFVLLAVYAIGLGLLFHGIGSAYPFASWLFRSMPWLMFFAGLAIGYFTGRMLLEKRFKVFHRKNFIGFGALLLSVAALLLLIKVDVLGVTRYVPKAEAVESVALQPGNGLYIDYPAPLTDPAEVESVIGLHRAAVKNRAEDGETAYRFYLKYRLKNGKQVERFYYVPLSDEYVALLQSFYSRPKVVMETEDPADLLGKMCRLGAYSNEGKFPTVIICNENYVIYGLYGPQMYDKHEPLDFSFIGSFADEPISSGLIAAMYKDCEAGTLSQYWNHTPEAGSVSLYVIEGDVHRTWSVTIYENCENTLAYLNSLQ